MYALPGLVGVVVLAVLGALLSAASAAPSRDGGPENAKSYDTVPAHSSALLQASRIDNGSGDLAVLEVATQRLQTALTQTTSDPAERRKLLSEAATEVASQLGEGWSATTRLRAALALDTPDAMAEVLASVASDLSFRPRMEAPVPPGWPSFTPVGEIRVERYPAYRAAFTTRRPLVLRESRNFWTLFQHISSRNIPMTAPVEMPMAVADGGLRESGMAFLYPDLDTGQIGEAEGGAVQVINVPPMTVVSIGIRGKNTASRVEAAYERLIAWLDANQDRWQRAGNPRVMGWNSPSVPDRLSYTQVQIPVRPVDQGAERLP